MDAATLNALPQVSFETSTIWTDGTISFSGPSLRSLMDQAGISDGQLTLTAINDYAIQVAVDEIEDNAPIVATLMNGEPISRREKGPYWLVYPYDVDAKYQSEVIYAQSIWQLVSIERDAEN
ncbi:molybdopterin-dependent oxidoreductase [Thalassobacter stenotrophicus]|uniref:molybdopterin-dependent oxidoreductase n=1 Tax=Thalassobacter stenotrophicus TaxID=266809 RepID=UPI001F2DA924|nr:molybdopterin-dependent oxidoreductase [Thalassobacter stenotrophicus]